MLQAHYVILEAENQRDALKLARESRPNLVMLNYLLPRTNIGRLCAKIREEAGGGAEGREQRSEARGQRSEARGQRPEVREQRAEDRGARGESREPRAEISRLPIILLVESAETIGMDQLRALGADDRIYKPLPVSIVEKRVKDLLSPEREVL
jgi:DNA-binding response OmpR family regulator